MISSLLVYLLGFVLFWILTVILAKYKINILGVILLFVGILALFNYFTMEIAESQTLIESIMFLSSGIYILRYSYKYDNFDPLIKTQTFWQTFKQNLNNSADEMFPFKKKRNKSKRNISKN